MKKMLVFSVILASAAALPVVAAQPCSIHPAKGISDAQLTELAKLSKAEAEKIAVARLNSKRSVTTASAELEAEHGCLIWSFDFRVGGISGVEEIQVDAGNGQVISVKHESVRQEATENSKGPTDDSRK